MIDRTVAEEVRRRRLTYLGPEKLNSLYDCVEGLQKSATSGDFVEFGVALGGSGICLAKALGGDRRYIGFDVFSRIPPPSTADGEDVIARYKIIESGRASGIGGDIYYGYAENLLEVVKENFLSFGCRVDDETIILVAGLFQDTLPMHNDISISLAHIDCDWYDPVSLCLNHTLQRMSAGGFIIVDDYNDWSGCRKATDEFLALHKHLEVIRVRPHAVLRVPDARG